MKTDIFKDTTAWKNQVLWLTLAFQSGYLNAGGFLAVQRFVSHVTGYGTYVGVALGTKSYLNAFEMALAPLFFTIGAAYAGWLVDRRVILNEEPRLQHGMIALASANILIWVGEVSGLLGEFGEPLELQRDFVLLFALCFACGLQNGLFSGLTSNQVRTTHLTGPSTDIGLNAMKIMALDRNDERRAPLLAQNWLRVKIVATFTIGSMIAVRVFPTMGHEGFAIPGLLSLLLAIYIRHLLRSGDPKSKAEERDGCLQESNSLVEPVRR